uniref:Uncharacterized protein n=1 Tax=Pseudo-nitzschia delicatissima TaxID=44447 RepID=A0A7S0UMR5_9STRA|mmetsp:Transcript_3305/g.6850  ORF Transcript_3305/g.6850 Transcript_3305/m.6850 type:complete len:120 (+) Transcript_3305:123-482(+)
MGSLTRKLIKGRRELGERRRKKIHRPDTDNMIPKANLYVFRFMLCAFFAFGIVLSGYAPNKSPKLPEGFCEHGDVTATTGECMCHWQHKDGCVGSKCQYQMGLSFYHYSCEDCKCVKEP